MGKLVDLTGQKFGRLLVVKEAGRAKEGAAKWLCLCDCGTQVVIRGRALMSGNTRSCGCLRKEVASRFAEKNVNWKGISATEQSGRGRAERSFRIGKCEICGEPGMDRHHKDGNTKNNSPSNIQCLCRKCHMKEDGRLDKLVSMERLYMKRGPDGRFIAQKKASSERLKLFRQDQKERAIENEAAS